MHVTKIIVRFDWSAVYESFRYKTLAPNMLQLLRSSLFDATFWYKFLGRVSPTHPYEAATSARFIKISATLLLVQTETSNRSILPLKYKVAPKVMQQCKMASDVASW